jgi:hypothetical protein
MLETELSECALVVDTRPRAQRTASVKEAVCNRSASVSTHGHEYKRHLRSAPNRQLHLYVTQRGLHVKMRRAAMQAQAAKVPCVAVAHLQLQELPQRPKVGAPPRNERTGTCEAPLRDSSHGLLPMLHAHVHARVGARAVHMGGVRSRIQSSCSSVVPQLQYAKHNHPTLQKLL